MKNNDRMALIRIMDAAGRADMESVLDAADAEDIAAAATAAASFLEEAEAGEYINVKQPHEILQEHLLQILAKVSTADPADIERNPAAFGSKVELEGAAHIAAQVLTSLECAGVIDTLETLRAAQGTQVPDDYEQENYQ